MRNLAQAIKPLLSDLFSTFVFAGVSAATHDPILATATAMGLGVGQVALMKFRGRDITRMQWMSLGLVLAFGTATIITRDPRFVMLKPTLVYIALGVVMSQRGWMVPYMPPAAQGRVPQSMMVTWGYVWAGLMFATAALNLVIAWGASFAAWSLFIAVFPLASKLVLFGVQFTAIRSHVIRQKKAEATQALAMPALAA